MSKYLGDSAKSTASITANYAKATVNYAKDTVDSVRSMTQRNR